MPFTPSITYEGANKILKNPKNLFPIYDYGI